jgi:nicotinamide riboside kinase
MDEAGQKQREKFHQELLSVLSEYKRMDQVVILDARGNKEDRFGYYARYLQALDAIQERTGFDIKHERMEDQ